MAGTQSWAKVSIGLATFSFINLVLFLTLSSPMDTLLSTVHNLSNQTNVSADVAPFISMIRTIFGLTFVLSMGGLIIWFFLGSHREEYEEY